MPGDQVVQARRYWLTYDDGAHDAESLLVDAENATAYVVTKDIVSPGVYQVDGLDRGDGNVLTRVADAPRVATDAAFDPTFTSAVVRSYSMAFLLPTPTTPVSQSGRLPRQPQGETIAWSADGQSLLSGSEGLRAVVHRVALPEAWLADVSAAREGDDESPGSGADGSSGLLPVAALAGVVVAGAGAVIAVSRAARRRSRSTE